MKKVAIPSRNDQVDSHFGHCEYYTIYTMNDENQVKDKELFNSPAGCGCKSNIAPILAGKGVSVMLAGNMGTGALNVLQSENISVIRGCSGSTDEIIKSYLTGKLTDNGVSCSHHHHGDEGHQCNH